MDKLTAILIQYLRSPNPPPNLVIMTEGMSIDGLSRFEKRGKYLVISRAEAGLALREKLGLPVIDWNRHWQQERQRPFGN